MDELIKFDKGESFKSGLLKIARFLIASNEAGAGINGFVHEHALKFNDPSNPASAAKKFELFLDKENNGMLASPEAKALKGLKSSEFSLKGKGAYAAACRKALNAMRYGGDLAASEGDNACDTISKCEKFAKKMKAVRDQEEHAAEVRKEEYNKLRINHPELDPESDEFKHKLEDIMATYLSAAPINSSKGKVDKNEEHDEWDDLAEEYAEVLRLLATGEPNNPTVARDMAKAAINGAKDAFTKAILNISKTRAGLIKEQSAT